MAIPLLLAGSEKKDFLAIALSPITSFPLDVIAGGSERCGVLSIIHENNLLPAVASLITRNGQTFTKQVTVSNTGSEFAETTSFYTLLNPDIGVFAVDIAISQGGKDIGYLFQVYTGVNQDTPVGNKASRADTSSVPNTTITLSTANSLAISLASSKAASSAPFLPKEDNTKVDELVAASGNSGFTSSVFMRGEEEAGDYIVGSSTIGSLITVCAIELLGSVGSVEETPINLLEVGENAVTDVKYYNGTALVDVELQMDGVTVWSI